jgi:hypothetical protein
MSDFAEMVKEADPLQPLYEALRRLNERYFVVTIGGTVQIGFFDKDEALGRERLCFIKPNDFRLKFLNEPYVVGFKKNGEAVLRPLGEAWLESPIRRQYEGAAFYTKGDAPPGMLNLWRGWGVEPRPGN